jgi:hypothetical protein
MGLSETIIAAMIGALATVTAALFQLFSALRQPRSSSKVDVRPKKGSAMRSVLAVLALMVASGAGGFLYSELIKQRTDEDMRAMRSELKELRALIAAEREAARNQAAAFDEPVSATTHPVSLPAVVDGVADSVESVVYVPACRADGPASTCAERDAQRIALCGTIPAYARVDAIELFAQPDAMQHPWEQHRVGFEQDLGGARFTGNTFEYAQGTDSKAVCVNFMQWSSEHPHIARVVVQFGFGNVPARDQVAPMMTQPKVEMPTQAPAVIAADPVPAVPTAAAFAAPATAQ